MKRIVFVSENRRLIEKMSAMLSARTDVNCSLLSTARIHMAVDDMKEFGPDLVILDLLSVGQKREMIKLYLTILQENIVSECVCLIQGEQTK